MAVQITRFHLGERAYFYRTKSGGLAYSYGHRNWYLTDPKREAKQDELGWGSPEPVVGPFQRADFGDRERLAWAQGACSIPHEVAFGSWANRFGLWLDELSLGAVDATRDVTVQLRLPIVTDKRDAIIAGDGMVYCRGPVDVVVVSTAEIEALFDQPSGVVEVHVRELYPHRRPQAKTQARVDYRLNTYTSLTSVDADDDTRWIKVPLMAGLESGVVVTLYDELMKGHFRELEIPGWPRETIDELRTDQRVRCELFVEPAVDPLGGLAAPAAGARDGELDRVFGMLADEPGDDAARIVVVDLLEDAGEPYAALLARTLAGESSTVVRTDALGTLAAYIHDVQWRGGLPWSGTLATATPADEDIGDLVAADRRLGFFHTLRLGEGNFRVYAKLVASPRAVGLRHVDGSRVQILTSLIAGQRSRLRRLSEIKFANKEVLEALADPTFDSVVELETETQAHVVDRLLDFVARDEKKFFARAPRHLVLVEKNRNDRALIDPVLAAWHRLPLDKLTMAGVTIARDGTARALDDDVPKLVREHIATRFRFA